MSGVEDEIHAIDTRLVRIETVLHRLETNHLAHVEADMAEIRQDMKEMSRMIFRGVIAFFLQLAVVLTGVIAFLATLVFG